MARLKTSPEDLATMRAVWEAGGSFRACETAVDGRASRSVAARAAVREGWVRANGERAAEGLEQRRERTAKAKEAQLLRWVEERDRVVGDLIGTVDHLLARVTKPHEIVDIRAVGGGLAGADVVVTRESISEPVPSDQKALLVSVGIAIDKLQLLTGEATARTENLPASRQEAEARVAGLRDEVAERRRQNAEVARAVAGA